MKSRISYLLAGVILLALVFIYWQSNKQAEPDPSQKASFYTIKCTVAKYLFEVDTTKQIAPLFKNLGDLHFTVTTENDRAQAFFDQGLKLTYAFNHAEAHRSFMEAARLDPGMAMAYWGQAYALGPNINDVFPDDERRMKSIEAAEKAKSLSTGATEKEKALIDALQTRYTHDLTTEFQDLNIAYMGAMTDVYQKFPDDADVLTLYAASVMNTCPWNYWDKEGVPSEGITEAKAALEKAIELNPDNPGAHHYYIHMVELPNPDLAVPSAERLGSLMPAAGHIVHMPSHIYIRVGRYMDAVTSNQAAILADEDYISQCYSQGMYPLGYYPHNIHFLWSAASLLGASDLAIDAAKKTAEKVPVGELQELPFLQDFASTPLLAYTRFGKWNEILTVPPPSEEIKHLRLIWHYARGVAFVRKNNLKEAEEELAAIKVLKDDPELEEFLGTFQNPTSSIAKVAYHVVAGEIAALKGDLDSSIKEFEMAVEFEDQLIYSEPPAWYIPTRQNLGDALMKANKFEEAESIYNEDLTNLRQNGWSLMGLHKSLKAQGKETEAQRILEEYRKAWEHADIEINSSIL